MLEFGISQSELGFYPQGEIMTTTRIAPPIETQSVIGLPVTALPFDEYVENIIHWAYLRLSKVVCVANVHMLTEARADARLTTVLHMNIRDTHHFAEA